MESKSIKTLDRLSELPDSLIFHIFGFLPMSDVVKTTILSKSWRNLWTTNPYLNFVDCRPRHENFITPTLMFWRGSKILKLKIDFCSQIDHLLVRDIDLWVRFAKDYEVEELYLHPMYTDDDIVQYFVPQYLLSSCPSLKVLSLKGCMLPIHGNVQWNQLKSLSIHGEGGLSYDVINQVLGGSPRLEILVLKFLETGENLSIRSSSLKKLSIDKYLRLNEEAPPMNTELIISTPNLETLEISSVPYYYCSLENVSCLTDVTLMFDDCNNLIYGNYFLEDKLSQILLAIKHVENVTLSDWCIKVIGTMKKQHLELHSNVSRLWDVKFLKLHSRFIEVEQIAGVLEIFPKVKMLVLEDHADSWAQIRYKAKSYLDFRPSLPDLTTVEVTFWAGYENSILRIVEIFLNYASRLEKMVFRLKGMIYRPPFFSASEIQKKLLTMKRSSPTAELIFFCEYS